MASHSKTQAIHQAVVVATQSTTIRGRVQPLAQVRVGGVPLLKRTLLTLAKEGIRRFVVVVAEDQVRDTAELDHQIAALDVSWILNDSRADEDGYSVLRAASIVRGEYLLVPCDRAFDPQIVRKLLQRRSAGVTLGVTSADAARHDDTQYEGGLVPILNYGRALARADASAGFSGLLTSNRDLANSLKVMEAQGRPLVLDRALGQLAARGDVQALNVGNAFWQPVTDDAGVAQADHLLLTSLRKSVDGFVARHVNRVFSIAVTGLLRNTGVRPNHVTGFSLGVSILAAILAAQATAAHPGWLLAGAVLWQLASMLDGVDGELARLKFSGSKLGEWFDTLTDDIGKFVFFIGSGIGAAATFGSSIWLIILAVAVTVQIGMSLAVYRKLLQTGSGSHYALTWDEGTGEKPLWSRFVARLEPISRRDSYVMMWLLLAAVGLVKVGIVVTLVITLGVLISELVSPRQARSTTLAAPLATPTSRRSLPPT